MWSSLLLLGSLLAFAPPSSLADAQRDEIAALRAERDALQAAITESDGARTAATRAITSEVEGLASELERLQSDNAARERRLPAGERAQASEAQQRQLVGLVDQLGQWLNAAAIEPVATGAPPELLVPRFEAALAEVSRRGRLRRDPEATWFDREGRPVRGEVLRIAQVAAIAWGDTPSVLIGGPEGLRQVAGVLPLREATADGLRVHAVLHDPTAPADPEAWVEASWRTTMKRGGPIMWVLFGLGCVAAVIALERALVVSWIAARWRSALRRIEALATADPVTRERGLAEQTSWIAAPLVIVARQSAADLEDATRRTAIEERATQAVIAAREHLFRRLSLLSLCAGVAPLAGLLGTVNGMITTFSVVTTKGTSDAQLLAGGISEALLTTQFGLAIAIPSLIGHALLSRGARRVLVAIEQAVLRHIHGVGPHHDHDHDHDHPRPPVDRASRQSSRIATVTDGE